MKIVGLIFSLLGNIGAALMFAVAVSITSYGLLRQDVNLTVTIVLTVLTIVLFIIGYIGNKIEDSVSNKLVTKYLLFKNIGWLPKVVGLIVAIAGAFIMFGGIIYGVGMLVSGIQMLICGSICYSFYGDYVLKHCKFCGSNFKGGGFQYEEIERSTKYIKSKNDYVVTSKMKFEFYCPNCKETTVLFNKMKTDAKLIDKFARNIIGK
ncbi:MAG: hypothetical protein IKA61_06595 [Clostridia bacterium]|nr:hypothetical protein [Clostridia bacterium]